MPDGDMILDLTALEKIHEVGDNELVLEIIDLFLETAPQRLTAAQLAEHIGDIHGVEQAVHALKSSAATLGAIEIYRLAKQVERLAADQKDTLLPPLLDNMAVALEQLNQRLMEEKKRFMD